MKSNMRKKFLAAMILSFSTSIIGANLYPSILAYQIKPPLFNCYDKNQLLQMLKDEFKDYSDALDNYYESIENSSEKIIYREADNCDDVEDGVSYLIFPGNCDDHAKLFDALPVSFYDPRAWAKGGEAYKVVENDRRYDSAYLVNLINGLRSYVRRIMIVHI